LPQPICVINPNSLQNVTASIARAVEPLAHGGAGSLQCVTLDGAPPGIVSQRDADRAAPLVAAFVEQHEARFSAFVLACYSDPGLFAAREVTHKPVIGIGQAGIATASLLGERIGVIAISAAGIARHWRYYRALGVERKIAGERSIDLSVAESGDETLALERMNETARTLRDVDGADVIVLGCAGMAALRATIEAASGLPVVDPCTAAVSFAIARVRDTAEGRS
jgi:Asp/Glu/hydantoin racemase